MRETEIDLAGGYEMAQKQYMKMDDVFTGKVRDGLTVNGPSIHGDSHKFYANTVDRRIAEYAAHAINSHDELVAENERLLELLDAAKAVVARWDTPNWKEAEPTAAVIGRLRAIISKCSGSAS